MKIRKQNQFTSYQFWSYIKIIPIENNFVLSDAEGKTSVPLLKDGIADLPLLRTLLVTNQKSREPSFWEVIDPFGLLAEASLAASRTLWWWLIVCLNFTLDTKALFCWYKQELWQQHKQLKTVEMNDAWPNIYNAGYIHQLQHEPFTKFRSQGRSTNIKDVLPWNRSQLIRKTISISREIVKSCAMKKVTPF